MSDKIVKAIRAINPNAEFSFLGEDLNSIVWNKNTTPIPVADIEAQFTSAEFNVALDELRQKRNRLLAETDHLALSDQTLSDDMRTYRQSLRDLTDGLTTKAEVDAVVFPTKP